MIEQIKNTIQDCNINFLIGSGLSRPFLPTLGNIENLLTELESRDDISPENKKLIRASLYKKYFDEVIISNTKVHRLHSDCSDVQKNYEEFLKTLNSILLSRKITLLSKEINLFTTNIDLFFEIALENLGLEYNDGFNGRFRPKFSLSNFKKSHFKKSLHYDNTAELPTFNLLKPHGSLSWAIEGKDLVFSSDLQHMKEIEGKTIPPDNILEVPDNATIDSLVEGIGDKVSNEATEAFLTAYEKLLIVVNPTKEKFKHTLMNQTYYELLRLYSNELEKENTVLFVMGFSFADEHICEITLRAANSNPTLVIYVFAYSSQSKVEISERLEGTTNNNIKIIAPKQEKQEPEEEGGEQKMVDKFNYDFSTLNKKVFKKILKSIEDGDALSTDSSTELTHENG